MPTTIQKKGIIYKFESPNNKAYIGLTINPELRYYMHIRAAVVDSYPEHTKPILRAISKYGIDNMKYEVLCTIEAPTDKLLEEWLNKMLIHFIKKFNSIVPNGYNLTSGGEGILGLHHTEETKQKISKNSTVKKAILLYSLDGEFIKEYESTAEASRATGIGRTSIKNNLRGESRYAGGYIWKFK